MDVSPKLAWHWLAGGLPKPKTLDDAKVQRFAQAMIRGEWKTDCANPIVIHNGTFVHAGHHRLTAVEESGVTVRLCVKIT